MRMKTITPLFTWLMTIALPCLLVAQVEAQQPALPVAAKKTSDKATRPKIALVLSGGGARGAAHIGVIKVLEEMRIPIDIITGTSIGALIGAAYASGTSVAELEQRIGEADWDNLLTDTSPREDRSFLRKEEDQARLLGIEFGVKRDGLQLPAGAISGQKLDALFSVITRYAPGQVVFDRMPIRFRAVATDAESGQMVVFDRGRLAEVMRASMSVPGAIAPFEIDGRLYLDGGLTRNLPVDIARELGADIIIAVNISSGLLKRDQLQSILGVSLQMINILTEQNMQASLAELGADDVLITPPLNTISSTDFKLSKQAIAIGATTAQSLRERLLPFALDSDQFRRVRVAQLSRAGDINTEAETIDEVRIGGLTRANERDLRRALEVRAGDRLDYTQIDAGISRIFGTGYFERVNYSLLNEGSNRILSINAREKQWGPNYLRIGLSMAADSAGEGRFNLLLRSQQTQFNAAGAEWRNDLQIGRDRRFASRFLQPFGAGSIVNLSAGVELTRRPIDIFQAGRRTVQYDVSSSLYGIDLGMDINRNAIARLGIVTGRESAEVNIGSALFPTFNIRQGGFKFRAIHDSLDDPSFPRTGRTASLDYFASIASLGASTDYRKIEANFSDQYSMGRHTISYAGRYGRALSGRIPVFDQFSLGGFLQLSGYRPGELLGETVMLARLSYYQQLPLTGSFLGRRVFAGVSGEIGRIGNSFETLSRNDNKSSLGLFLGADTAVGPLYFGYGRARERGTTFYFFLGQP
jgi:NTE family protein